MFRINSFGVLNAQVKKIKLCAINIQLFASSPVVHLNTMTLERQAVSEGRVKTPDYE